MTEAYENWRAHKKLERVNGFEKVS